MKYYLSLILVLFCTTLACAQNLPRDYFRSPLDIPLAFSGTFAEVRTNHFHSGIDCRTRGVTGLPVYAAADGYVSRINISPWGGGKVLYIDHPNGFRTVYMHLEGFSGDIARWVRDYQYEHHTYAFDQKIPQGLLRVNKGDIVARSGNSGDSGGPHLHFEIRYAHNDQTINPLYFGLNYNDNTKPTIQGIKIYPLDGRPIDITQDQQTVTIDGSFYTGIYASDASEGSTPRNGIDLIELYIDDILFWKYHMSTYLFEDTRAINTIIDYSHFCTTRQAYFITRRMPGSPLYSDLSYADYQIQRLEGESRNSPSPTLSTKGDGIISFPSGSQHKLEYRVFDHKGNLTKKTFFVKNQPLSSENLQSSAEADNKTGLPVFGHDENPSVKQTEQQYQSPFSLQRKQYCVSIKANTLYCNDNMIVREVPTSVKAVLPFALYICPKNNPLPPHKSYSLKFFLPQKFRRQAHLTIVNINGKRISACTTHRNGDTLSTTPRFWGQYTVMQDTVPPTIKMVNLTKGKKKKTQPLPQYLKIQIADNLSGIESYHCYLNGRWILAEYDGKSGQLIINTKDHPEFEQPGNKLKVVVSDACGNRSEMTFDRFR